MIDPNTDPFDLIPSEWNFYPEEPGTMARTISKAEQERRDDARTTLRGLLDQATNRTIYTVLKHVSSSGMTRIIDAMIMLDDQPVSVAHIYATATGDSFDSRGGVKMSGTGMDMGFALAYNISRFAYPGGYPCDGTDCSSNDHSNKPHPARIEGSMIHSDGGYRFDHRWL